MRTISAALLIIAKTLQTFIHRVIHPYVYMYIHTANKKNELDIVGLFFKQITNLRE